MTAIDLDKLRDRMHRAVANAEEDGCGAYINPRDLAALLDQIDQAEHRLDHWQEAYKREANRRAAAVTERDEWRQTAQDEHAAALDLIGVVRERDARIKTLGWRNGHLIDKYRADMADLRQESDEEAQALVARADQAEARIKAVADICDLSAEDAEDMDAISSHYASGYEIALQDIRRALEG